VIVLRFSHGYTNREIAVALGVAERTVATRLAAAKRRLYVELERKHANLRGTTRARGRTDEESRI
jgi:DNA-directed RNA polymerase specialized sigma24 family protein